MTPVQSSSKHTKQASLKISADLGKSHVVPNGASGMFYQLHMLRGFAVLLVVIDHSCLAASGHMAINRIWIELAWLVGFLGVTIFFVISGFIMVRTTNSTAGSAREAYAFLYRRVERIVPMYYLATAVAMLSTWLIVYNSSKLPDPFYLVCSLLFIPVSNGHNLMEPVLGQGWTLNYEMYFYLLFAASLILPQRGRTLALVAFLVATIAVGSLLVDDVHAITRVFRYLSAPIVINFGVGMLLGKNARQATSLHGPWQPLVISVILACIMIGGVYWFSISQSEHDGPFGWQVAFAVYALSAVCCWLCVWQNQPPPWRGIQGIAARFAMLLGDGSYMIYLFHLFVIAATSRIISAAGLGVFAIVVSCSAVSLIITIVLHLIVERPLNAFLKRRHMSAQRRVVADSVNHVVMVGKAIGQPVKLMRKLVFRRSMTNRSASN